MTARWVHRHKATGLYCVMRSFGLAYDGTLQEAKIYRTRNGGRWFSSRSASEKDAYEWVPVYLTLEKPE